MTFKKHDQEKPPLASLKDHYDFLGEISRVIEHGAEKYDRNNWKKCQNLRRYFSAALRHIFATMEGETLDEDSGLDHLAHAATNLAFLHYLMKNEQWDEDWELLEDKFIRKSSMTNAEEDSWILDGLIDKAIKSSKDRILYDDKENSLDVEEKEEQEIEIELLNKDLNQPCTVKKCDKMPKFSMKEIEKGYKNGGEFTKWKVTTEFPKEETPQSNLKFKVNVYDEHGNPLEDKEKEHDLTLDSFEQDTTPGQRVEILHSAGKGSQVLDDVIDKCLSEDDWVLKDALKFTKNIIENSEDPISEVRNLVKMEEAVNKNLKCKINLYDKHGNFVSEKFEKDKSKFERHPWLNPFNW